MVPDVVRPDGSRDLLRPRRHGLARAEPAAERVRCGGGAGAAAVEDVRRADGRRALLLFRDGRERFAQIRKGGSGHRDLVDVDMRDPLRHPSEPPVRRVLRRVPGEGTTVLIVLAASAASSRPRDRSSPSRSRRRREKTAIDRTGPVTLRLLGGSSDGVGRDDDDAAGASRRVRGTSDQTDVVARPNLGETTTYFGRSTWQPRRLRRPPPERLEAQRAVLPRRQLNPRPRAVRAAGRRRPGDQRRAPRAYQRREDAPETRFPLIDPSSARLEDQEEPRAQRPVRRDPARQRRLDVAALFSFRSVEERQAGRPRRGLGDRQISPVV
mmetsp:Transcript_23942/g.74809  ORF Transcript_23942/g.74809 Transcript_23942/m.74809 type:complete len:325 (-) Transcript_23942:677-1651(-)